MAVTFESITTSTGTASSATVTMPSTRPDGDLYVAILMIDDDEDLGTPMPTEWSVIGYNAYVSSPGPTIAAWWWEGNSEPASYTVDTGVGSEEYAVHVLRFSGADTDQPLAGFSFDTGSGSNGDAPAITTVADNTVVIRAISVDSDEVTSTPGTERAAGRVGTGLGYGVSTEAGPASAGSTGSGQFTHSSDTWVALTLAIQPERASISQEIASANFYSTFGANNNDFYPHPTNRPDNDLYIALLSSDEQEATITAPAHWTEEYRQASGGGNDQLTAWSFTGSSEPSSYTVTITSSQITSGILRIADGDTSDPIDVSGQNTGSAATSGTCPSVTTTNDNTIVLRILAGEEGMGFDDGDLPSDDVLILNGAKPDGQNNCAPLVVIKEQGPNPAGSTGTAAFSWSGAGDYVAATIAINLDAGGAGSTHNLTAAINAAGSLATERAVSFPRSVAMQGSGSIDTDFVNSKPRSAAINGALLVDVDATTVRNRVASIQGEGSVNTDRQMVFNRTISIEGAGSIDATGEVGADFNLTASISGSLAVATDRLVSRERSAAIQGALTLGTDRIISKIRSAAIEGVLSVATDRTTVRNRSAAIQGSSSVETVRSLTFNRSVAIEGAGSMDATGTLGVTFDLTAAINAVGSVVTARAVTFDRNVAILGEGHLNAIGIVPTFENQYNIVWPVCVRVSLNISRNIQKGPDV